MFYLGNVFHISQNILKCFPQWSHVLTNNTEVKYKTLTCGSALFLSTFGTTILANPASSPAFWSWKKDSGEKHAVDNIKTLNEGSNLSQFFGEKNIRKQSHLFLLGQLGSWKLELKAASLSFILYFSIVRKFVQKWNFVHELCPKSTELPVLLPRYITYYF